MYKKISIILSLFLLCISCSKQDNISMAQKELCNFYNYSTVDWNLIDSLYYRPYNCDWPDEIAKPFHPEFPSEFIPMYWNRLQNAKTYLHQQTLPLRIGASDEFLAQISHTESALDSVFVLMVTQPYYMRIFVDCYQEIMPQEIDKFFELLAE